jgi:hypothetical protein
VIGFVDLGFPCSAKKTPFADFLNRLLKNVRVEFAFFYALSPHHEGAKRNTIGVARGMSAKLSYYIGLTLVYEMENEMPLVHHVVEWWGCGCMIKDNKGLNERTRGHPMMKLMSKLMHVGLE